MFFTLYAVRLHRPILGYAYINLFWGWYVSIRAGNFSVLPARLASWGKKLFTALDKYCLLSDENG